MIKIIVRNIDRFALCVRMPVVRFIVFLDLRLLEGVTNAKIFAKAITQIKLANGIYKTTKPGRFHDVDDLLIQHLSEEKCYKVHDTAVSDGITSLELFKKLTSRNIELDYFISDKFAKFYFHNRWYGGLLCDADGHVIYGHVMGVQAFRGTSWLYTVSKLLGYMLPRQITNNGGEEIITLDNQVTALIKTKELDFVEFDVFENSSQPAKYDVVRCMNLLNPGVFSEEMLLSGIKNLGRNLSEDGLLLLGHTHIKSARNHVSFFRRRNSQLIKIHDLNDGYLLKEIVESIALQ